MTVSAGEFSAIGLNQRPRRKQRGMEPVLLVSQWLTLQA
jgi:hypothetical protein